MVRHNAESHEDIKARCMYSDCCEPLVIHFHLGSAQVKPGLNITLDTIEGDEESNPASNTRP